MQCYSAMQCTHRVVLDATVGVDCFLSAVMCYSVLLATVLLHLLLSTKNSQMYQFQYLCLVVYTAELHLCASSSQSQRQEIALGGKCGSESL